MVQADVVIVGAGLAGLSCAVALADDGLRVAVLESTSELGGRARSWTHASTGDTVDIGPHLVHSEYANFLAFLERLGSRHRITWQPKKLITLASQPPTVLRHRPLPPPLSLLPDLTRAPGLSMRDLWSNNRPTWRAMKFGEEDVPRLDRVAAFDYLKGEGVSTAMIDWFWRFATMAVMNVPSSSARRQLCCACTHSSSAGAACTSAFPPPGSRSCTSSNRSAPSGRPAATSCATRTPLR
jgi:uncharacterized protein with NAD-binding domain and iron-sulfur cluster